MVLGIGMPAKERMLGPKSTKLTSWSSVVPLGKKGALINRGTFRPR